MTAFKPSKMRRVQAALLMIGLTGAEFTAADLPGEVTEGSKHIAGAATGSLVAIGLLTVVDRIKSPRPDAKGRRVDVLRITNSQKAAAWLEANSFALPELKQGSLCLA